VVHQVRDLHGFRRLVKQFVAELAPQIREAPPMPFRHDDTDDLDDREFPEPDHEDELQATVDMVPCPFCKQSVYDNAEWCPHCRNYLFYEGPPLAEKPWWLIGGVCACLLVVLYWILRG
jgi:hypothetical protein